MTRRIFCKVLLVVIAIFGVLVFSDVLMAQGRSEDAFERVRDVQEKHTDILMARPGVVGTAVGLNDDGEYAVLVLLEIPGVAGIPQDLEGVPVQVVVTGEILALSVPIGVSTGNEGQCSAGTIGCRVTDGTDVYALSNNHVYALENEAPLGSEVLQPGLYDTGCVYNSDNVIGTLFEFEPIVFSRRARNEIDAAIALSSTLLLGTATPAGGYGTPSSDTVGAFIGQQVQKFGRTTGLTNGYVTGTNATVNVGYGPGKTAKFVKQIIIEPGDFSDSGDSGSLIVTDDGNANPVGLLFAGSSTMTVANPIDLVLSRFGVTVDGSDGGAVGNNPPNAGFSFTTSGLTASFTDQSTDSDGSIVDWYWDFGDGKTSTLQNPSHTYATSGTYTVTLTVTDNDDATDFISKGVSVSDGTGGGTLNITVTTDNTIYSLGDRVKITVTVTDKVEGAAVHVEITTATNRRYAGDATTNNNGIAEFSFKTKKPDGIGTYDITADASKAGYVSGSDLTTFMVVE
ncbi:MAG: PKD domain-containing protein [Planctomycetes bacterium]|nr:PKD domain-containing protein [Planctomycetota bacterium]